MPTLIYEKDVKLERGDLLKRIAFRRATDQDGFLRPSSRAHGLHLSGLLRYVATKSRITARLEEIAEEDLPLRWALGQAWEEFAASLYPDMLWQPGEILEPVIMNCDGLDYVDDQANMWTGPLKVDEFKLNRAKSYKGRDLIQKKWLWMQQGMGYCLGYGARYVEWHVLAVMEWPDPIYRRYLIEFSKEELEQTQCMIDVNKEAAIREGYAE